MGVVVVQVRWLLRDGVVGADDLERLRAAGRPVNSILAFLLELQNDEAQFVLSSGRTLMPIESEEQGLVDGDRTREKR